MKATKRINVEVLRKKFIPKIDAVQYDAGLQIILIVRDFTIPDGTTARAFFKKPSGKFVYQDCTISGNEITIDVHNQALTEYGDVCYQVRLTNGPDIITTFKGIIEVEKSLADNSATSSETVVPAFDAAVQDAVTEIEEARDSAITYIGNGLDNTLKVEGKAADAAAAGKAITELKGDLATLENGNNDDNNIVVYTHHTVGEKDYTINVQNDPNYVYEVIVTNDSETAGYFTLKRNNENGFSGSETDTKLLAHGESISILTPYNNHAQVIVFNPNDNKKGILIKKRSNKNIDFKNVLYRYQFVKNTYLEDAKPQAFPSEVIKSNGWNRFITIYNNSDNDGYFGIKVQNNSNSDVYSVSSENYPLIKAKSSYTFNIGNNEVRYIFVENPDVIDDFTLLLYENVHREKVYCGENRKYTKFIDALDYCNATGNCDLFVDAGVYDLISEIGESNMPTYITPNTSGHGCFIGNDTHLYMSSGAVIKCLYTGSNKTVNKDFAIFNVSNKTGFGDFEIHGGRFESAGIRYTVHDEAQGVSEYRHAYYECNMKNDNTKSSNPVWNAKQCIGGGLGQYGTVLIDGGIYNSVGIDSDTDKGTITYHNPVSGTSSTFKNNVTIKNVYFETGTCYVSCLGDDTTEDATVFVATNNNVKGVEPFANGLDNPHVNHNVTIKSWNNKIRS